MPDIIKKMTIVGSPNDTRDIGAEAQNVIVSYDANGNIIPDITASGVVIDHTDSATNAFAPSSHSDATNKYGVGDTTHYGHIKIGTGLEINSSTGATDIKFGAAAGTARSRARTYARVSGRRPCTWKGAASPRKAHASSAKTLRGS